MKDKKQIQLLVGKRIKLLREERNIPQQDLAAKCNIEKSNFSRLEAGGTNPTIYTLYNISENLNVTLSELTNLN